MMRRSWKSRRCLAAWQLRRAGGAVQAKLSLSHLLHTQGDAREHRLAAAVAARRALQLRQGEGGGGGAHPGA